MIANETVAGPQPDRQRSSGGAEDGPLRVTVITPVNQPREGYVVYEDTRRAAAGRAAGDARSRPCAPPGSRPRVTWSRPTRSRRLRDALAHARAAAGRDRRLDPPAAELGLAAQERGRADRATLPTACPVEHVVVDLTEERADAEANVLVVANETVVGEPLLQKIRERAAQGPRRVPDRLAAERRSAPSTRRPSAACAGR